MGGDILEYPDNASSPAASLLESKLIFNRENSDEHRGARFMSSDMKDLFLEKPMLIAEHTRIH